MDDDKSKKDNDSNMGDDSDMDDDALQVVSLTIPIGHLPIMNQDLNNASIATILEDDDLSTQKDLYERTKKSGVYVMTVSEKNGRRIYEKRNSCFFCGKEFAKLSRHFFQVHKDEEEVAKGRELCGTPSVSLCEILKPGHFDDLIASARSLREYSGTSSAQNTDRFKAPSTAVKCGYALKKAAFVVKGQALRNKDMATKSEIDLFLELYETEWSAKVTSQALQTLTFKKHNKPQYLPVTNDLLILRKFLIEYIPALTEEVRKNPVKENWQF
ncbi:Hypothetical predicted protein [Paramuricea clavata]|uniref:Uncharacterized protein n=1 Tax=Paramuricea clavata TaxID=317549 RepID=A0A7D9IUE9_PARCT|nr:Hypothetical predicted protein [Paramuricea clavata]